MIQVLCGSCDETFEVGDESAGLTEFCPACGALNDIPSRDTEKMEQASEAEFAAPAASEAESTSVVPPVRPVVHGIPSGLWWGAIVSGIGAFIVICFFLFSNNWESEHVRFLSDAVGRGDASMVDEDFAGADREYRSALDAVGDRPIQSTFIRQLMDHARQSEADARSRLRMAATTAPSLGASGSSAGVSAASQPSAVGQEAMRDFQRECEGFAEYVRSRPVLFRDGRGNWRRRQFVVWDVNYQQEAGSDPPEIVLRYSCQPRITEPQDARADAADDPNFADEEQAGIARCQTLFAWYDGGWVIVHREIEGAASAGDGAGANPSVPVGASLGELYMLEESAFHARAVGGESP